MASDVLWVVTRFERYVDPHEGFVHPARAFIALNRIVNIASRQVNWVFNWPTTRR